MHVTLFAKKVLLMTGSCTSSRWGCRSSSIHRQGRAHCSSYSRNSCTWNGECSSCVPGSTNQRTWRDSCAWIRWWCGLRRRSPCTLRWTPSQFSSQQLDSPAASACLPCTLSQRRPAQACDSGRNGRSQLPNRGIRTSWRRLFPCRRHFESFSAPNKRENHKTSANTRAPPMISLTSNRAMLCVSAHANQ